MQYIGHLVVQGRSSQTRHHDYKTGWQSQLVGQEGKGLLRYLQKHLPCLVCCLLFLSHSCSTYFLTSFCLLKHLKESGGCLVYGSLCCLEICWKDDGGFWWWLMDESTQRLLLTLICIRELLKPVTTSTSSSTMCQIPIALPYHCAPCNQVYALVPRQ